MPICAFCGNSPEPVKENRKFGVHELVELRKGAHREHVAACRKATMARIQADIDASISATLSKCNWPVKI